MTSPAPGSYGNATFHATPVNRDNAVDTLVAAFLADPVTQWLVPDANRRYGVMYHNFRIFVDHALGSLQTGSVVMDTGLSAAALWFTTGDLDIPGYADKVQAACGRHTKRFLQLDEAFDRAHPAGAPRHHYLMLLGVRPEAQGLGLGTLLLQSYQSRLRISGTAAYLVASNDRNRKLYLRNGFRDHGDPIDLPDGGPRMYPMWWQPAPLQPPPDVTV